MRYPRPQGFSLVELMVTLVIALLLLVGIARVFVTSKQSYRVQESTSRMQENIRVASDYFSRYLRQADFWGGVRSGDITVLPGSTAIGKGSCTKAWIMNPAEAVVGYAGATSRPTGMPSGCLTRYVNGSDAIAIRYANPDDLASDAELSRTAVERGPLYLRARLGFGGVLFDVRDAALDEIRRSPRGGPEAGVFNYKMKIAVFHIQTQDFGTGPVPTLSMLELDRSSLTTAQLVDGIETLAFAYGLDSDDDQQVDRYREAAAVSDWRQVLSVRVSFVARGDELDNVIDTSEYALTASRCYGPASSTCASRYSAADARFQRRLVVQEIQLRNRVRG
ncbi:MAG: hypothetical protein C0434_10280 [Xanthomonadaceae bacterium]|nr:hypothetical protein [Xanthomonadaceae bacterium]